ncbi:helix-turn-helix domain-containing protein [Paraburkholderia humisilvae]|uniref:Uncharacterized protein n=1 Tax=Paraburkholderia humisilvae TaxID=627669 RepID=A0A6J5F5A7_9BURK|nr:helix-turn-helix domain-containing protein [Paraburkholderia humisilvae]CAB3773969.1 hypothetical protein LMG29542_07538 [Paraburkholderia humisilvae]
MSGQSIYNWSHTWCDSGVCGLTGGHNGGRPPALSDAMITTALEVAQTESLPLAQIGQRVQVIYGKPLPCRIETLGEALKREGFSFKRNRYGGYGARFQVNFSRTLKPFCDCAFAADKYCIYS